MADFSIHHYLISFSLAGQRPGGDVVGAQFAEAFHRMGLEPISSVAYVSDYPVDPSAVGLQDAWRALPDDDRAKLSDQFPLLAMAIMFLCGEGR